MRSAPGSKTDPTMSKLAAFKRELERTERTERQAAEHQAGQSKSARKRAAKRVSSVQAVLMAEQGATRPGARPKLHSGSVQVLPPKGRISHTKGIRLKPFTDFIPRTPNEYGTGKDVQRDSLDIERARKQVRSNREAVEVECARPSGMYEAHTGAMHHADDKAAGVIRDKLGRVIRTADMPDCEVRQVKVDRTYRTSQGVTVTVPTDEFRVESGLTPHQLAARLGVPGTRTALDQRTEAAQIKRAEVEARKAERLEKRTLKDRAKRARAEERTRTNAAREANLSATRKLRDTARATLAAQGVTKPSALEIRNMLDFFEANMQRARYTQASLNQAA